MDSMMHPDNFDGGFLEMPNYFPGTVGEMVDIDGGGGFYGYRLPSWLANYELPVPPGIFDHYYGHGSSSELTETAADEKTLAALRNHKEAEKRRRERINSHLDRLRALIPSCTSKTDKATLLALVVQRLRELKQETSKIMKEGGDRVVVPSESDECSVVEAEQQQNNGKFVLRASLCCEDRSDLFTDVTEVVNALHLKTLRAEMSTLGGRTRNVLIVSGDQRQRRGGEDCAAFLHDALKGIVHRSRPADRLKRRRRFQQQL